jgi:hypothetical protein
MIVQLTRKTTLLALLGVGLAGSQAGHLLAFQLRFGSAAMQLESTGAHAYFPMLAKTAIGAVAAVLVIGMFVVGLARMLCGGRRVASSTGPKYIELLAALFTIQLAIFISQEVAEAMVGGFAAASAAHLLLWGTLGQLPVAAVAAIALGWLWIRLESAIDDLSAFFSPTRVPWSPIVVVSGRWPVADRAMLLAGVAGGSLGKRGPPTSSRFS